jgi:uncharacterized RDD family membrane protein YckC/DNA-binding HxlR family transcriptional regulator
MAVDQENVSRIFTVLSHPLRREILLNLSQQGDLSFTDLLIALKVDTGKLSFHIRNLAGFIEQTETNKYRLTKSGEHALALTKEVETWAVEADVERRASAFPIAGLRKRAYAYLIDFVAVLSVLLVTVVMTSLLSSIYGGGGGGFRLDVNVILFVSIFWIYSTLLEGFGGQSVGKRIVGLVVVRVDGKKVLYDNAGVRNLGKVFILLPFDLLIGLQLKDKRFLRYFDKFAGTTVVDLRSNISSLPPDSEGTSPSDLDARESPLVTSDSH